MSKGRFFLNAVLIAGLLALFLHWLETPLVQKGNDEPPTAEEKAYISRIHEVTDGQLTALIKQQAGKPTLVLFYASWCGYCKKQFPILRQLQQETANAAHFLYISLDEKPENLSRFLLSRNVPNDFTPYRYASDSLSEPLEELGVPYEGGIPFMAIFRADGSPGPAFLGLTEGAEIAKALK